MFLSQKTQNCVLRLLVVVSNFKCDNSKLSCVFLFPQFAILLLPMQTKSEVTHGVFLLDAKRKQEELYSVSLSL